MMLTTSCPKCGSAIDSIRTACPERIRYHCGTSVHGEHISRSKTCKRLAPPLWRRIWWWFRGRCYRCGAVSVWDERQGNLCSVCGHLV